MSVMIRDKEKTLNLNKNFRLSIPRKVYLNEDDLLETRQKCWHLIKEYAQVLAIKIYANPFKFSDCDTEELIDEEMVRQVEDCIVNMFVDQGANIVNVSSQGQQKRKVNLPETAVSVSENHAASY